MESSAQGLPPTFDAQPAQPGGGEISRRLGATDVIFDVAATADQPRAGLRDAVAACHSAGARIIVVTAADGPTALRRARQLGIVGHFAILLQGWEIEQMPQWDIEVLLGRSPEIVVAGTTAKATGRIAEVLEHLGHTVATGLSA